MTTLIIELSMCMFVSASDPSQSDPDFRDFWFNMQALTFHLQREAELNPQASYYNVGLLKYQVRETENESRLTHTSLTQFYQN